MYTFKQYANGSAKLVFTPFKQRFLTTDSAFPEIEVIDGVKCFKKNGVYFECDTTKDYLKSKRDFKDYAMSFCPDLFLTLTFNPDKVDSFDFDLVSSVSRKWFNNAMNRDIITHYIFTFEKHKSGRYHIHALVKSGSAARLIDSGHVHNNAPIFNLYNWKNGFSTVQTITPTSPDYITCINYLCKYISKGEDIPDGRRRYYKSNNLKRPDTIHNEEFITKLLPRYEELSTFTKPLDDLGNELIVKFYKALDIIFV